jgi:hypothetical protein
VAEQIKKGNAGRSVWHSVHSTARARAHGGFVSYHAPFAEHCRHGGEASGNLAHYCRQGIRVVRHARV